MKKIRKIWILDLWEEPKKLAASLDAHFRIFGGEGRKSYRDKILHRVGVPDVITHANLGDDRFRGFWGSGGQISHFSIDLRCRP